MRSAFVVSAIWLSVWLVAPDVWASTPPAQAGVAAEAGASGDGEAEDGEEAPPPPPPPTLAVHCAHVDDAALPLAEGYCEWFRRQLHTAGAPIEPGPESRSIPRTKRSIATLAERAREGALDRFVTLGLHHSIEGMEIDLEIFELTDPSAENPEEEGAKAEAPAKFVKGLQIRGASETIVGRSHPLLTEVLSAMGVPLKALPPTQPVTVDQLSAATRALAHQDRGRLARAWKELHSVRGASRSPLLSQLRLEIEALAGAPETQLPERARVLALRGEGEAAWALISGRARLALDQAKPRLSLVLAAADVLYESGRIRQAGIYYDKALAVDGKNLEAALGRARVLAVQRKNDESLQAYQYARKLAPNEAAPALEMAELDDDDRARQAATLLAAGKLSAVELRTRPAHKSLSLAQRLDPRLTASAEEESAALHQGLGEHSQAVQAFQLAVEKGGGSVARFHGLAKSQRVLGENEGAELSLLQAVELDENNEVVIRELGDVYTDMGRTDEAIVQFEKAMALPSEDPMERADTKRAFARALKEGGEPQRALKLMVEANQTSEPRARDLMELALLQQMLGQTEQAQATVNRALEMRRMILEGNSDFASLYNSTRSGGPKVKKASLDDTPDIPIKTLPTNLTSLVQSFVESSTADRVMFLGVREKPSKHPWFRPLRVKLPDLEAVQADVHEALSIYFPLRRVPDEAARFEPEIAPLFEFDSTLSREGDRIVRLNQTLGSDALYVAQLDVSGQGCASGEIALELRSLGMLLDEAQLLGNRTCLPGGVEAGYEFWNKPVLAGIALVIAYFLFALLRGYGTVEVNFDLPPGSEALFAVSVSRRPRKFKASDPDRQTGSGWMYEKRLSKTSRFERRLKGRQMVFKMVAARWRDYYVTVRGPMMDRANKRLIGDFLEEKTVRVRAWKRVLVDFDFQPKECAVEVRVSRGADSIENARAMIKGRPDTERFTSDGAAYLFVAVGNHVLLVCDESSVSERSLIVASAQPMQVSCDLSKQEDLVFGGCPGAVGPYLLGDLDAAADALEAAGQMEIASRFRAEARLGGSAGGARVTASPVAIPVETNAVPTAADTTSAERREELATSATLLEQAGDFGRAAEVFREAGDLAKAAHAFEQAYDYENAVDCYRSLGDEEKVLALLEAKGDFFEAGEGAHELGQEERAIAALQQVDGRHPRYAESCRLLARLLSERGDVDVAIGKYEEAISITGDEHTPLDDQARYGALLEQSGRGDDALAVYEKIRRRDLSFEDVNTRIEGLKKDRSQATAMAGNSTVTTMNPRAEVGGQSSGQAAIEERYEIESELGRGGMGVVYKATDKRLGRTVALKVLPENLRQHPTALELFEREARSAAALNHPNIVTVFDASHEGDAYYMTMECMEGLPLDQILKNKGVLPTRLVAELGAQAAAGLEYARQQRIVHRDIKPSNLFVTREKVVKIMDFGLAKMIEEVRKNSTMIGGTPNFMAPEQAMGEAVDHRTDLYALGVTLFQLVTGTVPFKGGDLAYHHRHTPCPDPRERVEGVHPHMAQLIMKMMEKSPDARVQTAAEVQGYLMRIRDAC